MFLRTVKAGGGSGVVHQYVRLVEAYWEDGRSKQRTVANLGRTDLLAPHVERLVQILRGRPPPAPGEDGWVPVGQVVPTQAAEWGPFLVPRTLWRDLGLEAILDGCAGAGAPPHAGGPGAARRSWSPRSWPTGRWCWWPTG